MSNCRSFIAVGLLGVIMSCTLVTVHAADYRKPKESPVFSTPSVSLKYSAFSYDLSSFLLPDNSVVFTPSVIYLKVVNDPKPRNRMTNGLINHRREQERISVGLKL